MLSLFLTRTAPGRRHGELEGMMGWAQSFSGRDGKGESLCLCQEPNSGHPASCLVTVLSYSVICGLTGVDLAVCCAAPGTASVVTTDGFKCSEVLRILKTVSNFKYFWKIFMVYV